MKILDTIRNWFGSKKQLTAEPVKTDHTTFIPPHDAATLAIAIPATFFHKKLPDQFASSDDGKLFWLRVAEVHLLESKIKTYSQLAFVSRIVFDTRTGWVLKDVYHTNPPEFVSKNTYIIMRAMPLTTYQELFECLDMSLTVPEAQQVNS